MLSKSNVLFLKNKAKTIRKNFAGHISFRLVKKAQCHYYHIRCNVRKAFIVQRTI
jgi:hypothetical protein